MEIISKLVLPIPSLYLLYEHNMFYESRLSLSTGFLFKAKDENRGEYMISSDEVRIFACVYLFNSVCLYLFLCVSCAL